MSVLNVITNPIRALVTTLLYPFSVPIQIVFNYPFPVMYPHHQLKQAKREGKTTHGAWVNETDAIPKYLHTTNYRFRGIIGIDMERCTGCRRCERICPNKIIRMVPRSDEEILERFPELEINPINKKKVYPEIYYGRCLYCGYCGEEQVSGCPFDALNLTNLYDLADVFDDNLIMTPERLQEVVEKVGRGTRNFWTQEVKKPKAKKKPVKKKPVAKPASDGDKSKPESDSSDDSDEDDS